MQLDIDIIIAQLTEMSNEYRKKIKAIRKNYHVLMETRLIEDRELARLRYEEDRCLRKKRQQEYEIYKKTLSEARVDYKAKHILTDRFLLKMHTVEYEAFLKKLKPLGGKP